MGGKLTKFCGHKGIAEKFLSMKISCCTLCQGDVTTARTVGRSVTVVKFFQMVDV